MNYKIKYSPKKFQKTNLKESLLKANSQSHSAKVPHKSLKAFRPKRLTSFPKDLSTPLGYAFP